MRRPFEVAAKATVLAVAVMTVTATVIYASNWGSNTASAGTPAHPCDTTINSQCTAEVNTIPIEWGSPLAQSHIDAMTYAMTWYQNNTTVYPYLSALSPDRVTTVSDTSLQNGAWAWGQCGSGATYGGTDPYVWCRPSLLKWNTYYESGHFSTTTQKREIACHEVGHLAGLRHSSDSTGSCMYNPATTPGVLTPDSHDRSMISSHY